MAGNAASRISDAAARLCLDAGLGHVTMRSVATAADVAPSAVVYHFKTRDRLLAAMLDRIEDGIEAWRAATAATLNAGPVSPGGPGALVSAVLCALVDAQGLATVAVPEVIRALRTTDSADRATAIMARADRRADAFWQSLPVLAGLDDEARAIWAAVAQGLVSLIMLDRVTVTRHARIIEVLMRLEDRLCGRAIMPAAAPALPAAHGLAERPAGKQQIVEATIRLSGKVGIDGLTHRNIAAEAGLSVASTTYFYPSKDDIVVDAAHELQARAINAVVADAPSPPEILSRIALDADGHERADLAALAAFATAAVRLPDLHELAATFRNLRGAASVQWLAGRGFARADRLDGIIWSAATQPLIERASLLPIPQRAAFLDTISAAWMQRLFG
ncbi:TetR family transcriptional regulator [Sphingomonas sp. KC8]|uniref:TetR family transcriptional regulator n=1 Tax=Sphingomonas sp. KC8 TaxID=1030157 RepID=UPI000A31BA81|nr:TetR family transcriptional regulator [Sphingomonas sp. KC8]ARS28504.1 hypothetical protein KC8_14585 [Sphingomonas sp. KC8]